MAETNQSQQDIPQVQPDDKLLSTTQTVSLISFEPEVYAGYTNPDEDSNFVIFFKDETMLGITGDQGTGKSSLLECIQELMGGDASKRAINSQKGKKAATLTFLDKVTNRTYSIRMTNKSFAIYELVERNGEVTRQKVEEAKTWLRSVIGPIGISPMKLREMKGAEQIEEIRNYLKLDKDTREKEKAINKAAEDAYDVRSATSTKIRQLRNELTESGYFVWVPKTKKLNSAATWGLDKEKFQEDATEKEANALQKFNDAEAKRDQLNSKTTDLNNINKDITDCKTEIERLRQLLEAEEKKFGDLQDKRTACETELQALATAEEEYNLAKAEYTSVSDYKLEKAKFDAIAAKHDKYWELQPIYKTQDEALLQAEKDKSAFIKSITPDIEGLEVCIPESIDKKEELKKYKEENPDADSEAIEAFEKELDLKMREGLYRWGRSTKELSESEMFDLCWQLGDRAGVKMYFIENIQVFGSDAIARINELKEKGHYVFFTAMQRSQKKLAAKFYKEVPNG